MPTTSNVYTFHQNTNVDRTPVDVIWRIEDTRVELIGWVDDTLDNDLMVHDMGFGPDPVTNGDTQVTGHDPPSTHPEQFQEHVCLDADLSNILQDCTFILLTINADDDGI